MNFRDEHILIIDDEPNVQDSVERVLIKMGFTRERVHKAGGAREGCRLARRFKPATAIIDIDLDEDINGIGAAKLLRDDIRNPPIFYSAFLNKYSRLIKTMSEYEVVEKRSVGWKQRLEEILREYQFVDKSLFHRSRVTGEIMEVRTDGVVIVKFYSHGEEEVRAFPIEMINAEVGQLSCGLKLIGINELWFVEESIESEDIEEELGETRISGKIDIGKINKGLEISDEGFLDYWGKSRD